MIKNNVMKIIVLVLIILSIISIFIYKKIINSEKVKVEMKSDEKNQDVGIYSANTSKVVKMLNFVQDGCPPCKQMKSLILELKQEYEGRVEIEELDIYLNSNLAEKYDIMYTPTQIFLDKDNNVIYKNVGFLGKNKIKEIIDKGGVY
mgnify:FL=1